MSQTQSWTELVRLLGQRFSGEWKAPRLTSIERECLVGKVDCSLGFAQLTQNVTIQLALSERPFNGNLQDPSLPVLRLPDSCSQS